MKPFPLQLEPKNATDSRWRRRLRLEQFPSESTISTRKLRDYYHRLGFIPDEVDSLYVPEPILVAPDRRAVMCRA